MLSAFNMNDPYGIEERKMMSIDCHTTDANMKLHYYWRHNPGNELVDETYTLFCGVWEIAVIRRPCARHDYWIVVWMRFEGEYNVCMSILGDYYGVGAEWPDKKAHSFEEWHKKIEEEVTYQISRLYAEPTMNFYEENR